MVRACGSGTSTAISIVAPKDTIAGYAIVTMGNGDSTVLVVLLPVSLLVISIRPALLLHQRVVTWMEKLLATATMVLFTKNIYAGVILVRGGLVPASGVNVQMED